MAKVLLLLPMKVFWWGGVGCNGIDGIWCWLVEVLLLLPMKVFWWGGVGCSGIDGIWCWLVEVLFLQPMAVFWVGWCWLQWDVWDVVLVGGGSVFAADGGFLVG
ncbi:hypothetical protein [Lewinella sp. W8]|uniref:hypothetical protein n=1 Tax=Lewinella sp. W8 TaxID=2528208 RepID=UPI00110059FB|nr:hypothetical protein [Lewinella sp. W8]MTB50755.1 hypothetical protein [Lewinella sp. W8]